MWNWDRQFQVWLYSVSHSELVIMSAIERGYDSRICLRFKGVSFISLPACFECHHMYIDSVGEEKKLSFDVSSTYVVCLCAFYCKDELSYSGEVDLFNGNTNWIELK